MPLVDTRRAQMYPVLDAAQCALMQRFASAGPRRFAPAETVFEVGDANAPMWLVLEGSIEVIRRDGLGHEKAITTHAVGQFSGEVSQLAGRASLAGGHAGSEGCIALPLDTAHLRALMVSSAEIGEIVMRALILRRVGLIEGDAAGSVLIGRPNEAHLTRLQGFLTRNGYPNTVLDVSVPGDGRSLVERLGIGADELPVMVCPNGSVLRCPTDAQAAHCLGITPDLDPARVHDVVIVGAGPAGLATAVYAASEGLSVLVLDQRAIGGQAGASARIENYLGFPTGISGQALAGRAYNQAMKFGAELALPLEAVALDCVRRGPEQAMRLRLDDGSEVQARTVVLACGARYRRPAIDGLERFEGSGVSYWASPVEARLCQGQTVALVGGGNSAGQAVVFLAPRVEKLHLIVRGDGLEASMSRYLIERIAALPNVELHVRTDVLAVEGDAQLGLQQATFRERGGATRQQPLQHLFLFVGADPNTGWVSGCVPLDDAGFVVAGVDSDGRASAFPLQTKQPGVFAIGDVRAGSVKRVAAAVGEGAAVVAQIHRYLAQYEAASSGQDTRAGEPQVAERSGA